MENRKCYDNFPIWMVAAVNVVTLGIYVIGLYIMFDLGAIWGWLYLAFCLFAEIRIMRMSCIHCYYYGRWCGLGRGKLASLFFRKGDPKIFLAKNITWKDLIPDILVSLIPFILGIYMLFKDFSWLILILLAVLLFLTTVGNGFIRGNIVCKYCKQREFGCPAEKLFANK